ncbi:SAM-dependent methyltransferase [Coprococcus catus]|uniref:class I SAM-dependent methyltransferase n=1 Tax=Coprococcus catus TaxID=116085 RepID=UPI001D091E6D|nr:SAM-dependent methyltransferase [Coprococcus catus]MCB6493027.1 SAM-dependent methyltransferase [Coprococcus catus]
MNQIEELLKRVLTSLLVDMVISGARGGGDFIKIKVRPVMIRDSLYFQVSRYTDKQVFHENMTAEDALETLSGWILHDFRQAQIRMQDEMVTVLVSKKGKATVKSKKAACIETQNLEHNRKKQYIIEEGTAVPFMIDLGVMTESGKIIRTRYDKYRQINRFLEFIEDILPELPTDRTVHIIDFGCGKSYLTFAMYYYLKVLKHYDIRITGLDLKQKVIEDCQALADRYGYDGLQFLCGDIADYNGTDEVDMVVTLHACDTATDYALYKAVKWHASVILSVPCCQHELNRKMQCETLSGAFQYGLIKEWTAALMTDAMRGQLLEMKGYKTQLLEFIDMEHTPKNILIRGVKSRGLLPKAARKQQMENYQKCRDFFGAELTLEKLFKEMEGEMAYEQN